MLTADGVVVMEVANNAKVNDTIVYTSGKSCAYDDQNQLVHDAQCGDVCAFDAEGNIPTGTVVKYTKKASGALSTIVTAGHGGADADFTGAMSTVANAEFEAENSKLDGAGYLDADAKVFAIDRSDAKESKMLTVADFEDKNDYTVLGMFATEKADDNDMVVVDAAAFKAAGATSGIAVITGVSETSNDEGEEVLGVSYYVNGEEVEGLTDAETAAAVTNLTIGDVVKIKATNGVITSIKFIANFVEDIRVADVVTDYTTGGYTPDYTPAADEKFAAGIAKAYKKSSNQITFEGATSADSDDETYKLLGDANKYVIDFTAADDIVIGTTGSYKYFKNIYEDAVGGDTFTVKKNGSVIDAAATASEAIALTDYVVVREYDGRVTDVVIIRGADTVTKN
jgi:hypothetical protein